MSVERHPFPCRDHKGPWNSLGLTAAGRKGDAFENGMQRDNWFASVIFEDWENGVREHVDKLMARR